ncbi:sugar transferase [Microvirga massiliensis]|uniref:sugar transferase n=1 Tax=Microvirga massiliensis TaxID=1033741 RepID=UPI00062BCFE8|nr:sugar transferase [Microvirga massiliensis]
MISGEAGRASESQIRYGSIPGGRALDLIVAIVGLILLCPVMMLVVLAIWVESGWPVFFSQERLAQGGRSFRIHKFRKFHRDSGTNGPPLTTKDDSRLTQVGKFIDRAKLNELPQLWNVLKGDMSIVGPRPETLDFADCFKGTYRRVLDYKPGIIGPSQVFFRNEVSFFPEDADPSQYYREVLFPLKARIDMAYFSERTVLSDIGWIVCGAMAVFGWRLLSPDVLCHAPEASSLRRGTL